MPRAGELDLFLSCAGPDREPVRTLLAALEKEGLRVFLDERSIGLFDPITEEIEAKLRSAKALLAFYSRHYTSRPACQQELTAAFLAGQREGDPMLRIVVVNPEDPDSAHLLPAELADRRYAVPPVRGADYREVARQVRDRVGRLSGTLGEVRLTFDRRWYGRAAGSAGFVGRYREQWELHTALCDLDFPLTRDATSAAVANLVGMPGMGKTSLAAAYAWNFGAAYADGAVCWLSLSGAGPSATAVLARYEDEVRTLAEQMGLRPADAPRARLLGLVADHLGQLPGPSLWVVDDVPDELDSDTVRQLVLPGSTRVRTLITAHADRGWDVATPIPLDPMAEADVAALLALSRAPEPAERPDFTRLVRGLRGHPLVVRLAANELRDRQGLVSFADYADRLAADPDTLAAVTDLLDRPFRELSAAARSILRLARACAATGLPARFVGAVVERLLGPGLADGALVRLKDLALARRDGTGWRIHSAGCR